MGTLGRRRRKLAHISRLRLLQVGREEIERVCDFHGINAQDAELQRQGPQTTYRPKPCEEVWSSFGAQPKER